MLTTWVIIASRDQVRIFSRQGLGKLQLEYEVENAAGRLKNQDIESDKHGASTDNRYIGRHAYSTEEEARDRALVDFYRGVIHRLDHEFVSRRIDRLVIAAEPRLLGFIRPLLTPALDRALTQEIRKDLWHERGEEIGERLS